MFRLKRMYKALTFLFIAGCLFVVLVHFTGYTKNKSDHQHYQKVEECSGRKRGILVKQLCANHSEPSVEELFKKKRFQEQFLVDDARKTIFCFLPKTGSSTWKYLLASLTGKVKAEDYGKTYLGELQPPVHHAKYMRKLGIRYMTDFSPEEVKLRLANYFKFIVVRHPYIRLVSAYKDKFLLGRPPGYVSIARSVLNRDKKAKNKTITKIFNFERFSRFVIEQYRRNKIDEHWNNYQNMCHPCSIHYDYIAKTETMLSDFKYITNLIAPGTNVTLPHYQKTSKGINASKEVFSNISYFFAQLNPPVRQNIYEIFAKDMQMFDYGWNNDTFTATCGNSSGQCC